MSTIAAIATPQGSGGIAVIRLSGPDAMKIADAVWKGKSLASSPSHSAHLGEILDSDGGVLDQAVATVFAEGRSFTGENTVEFAIHGSPWLQKAILARLIEAGAEMAAPGEFSQRAVINGRIDLAQAEGIADLIAASSKASHRLAANQMKGNFSKRLDNLRQQIIDMASLLELELDFSEEDVEFADRERLRELCIGIKQETDGLADSFRTGRALKEGVATVIAGQPNAGKSSLLNRLLEDDKAIVSDIPGTTRDIIEDTIEIDGILYRFIDTAGLREASDEVEQIGIRRAYSSINSADIILYLIDPTADINTQISSMTNLRSTLSDRTLLIPIISKSDSSGVNFEEVLDSISATNKELLESLTQFTRTDSTLTDPTISLSTPHDSALQEHLTVSTETDQLDYHREHTEPIKISAKTGEGIPTLTQRLKAAVTSGYDPTQTTIVTNLRHYQELRNASAALDRTLEALNLSLPGDLIAQDLRQAIHHIGTITGAITTDTLLQTIFSRFCIGK